MTEIEKAMVRIWERVVIKLVHQEILAKYKICLN